MFFNKFATLFQCCFGLSYKPRNAAPVTTTDSSSQDSALLKLLDNSSDNPSRILLSDGRYLAYQERGVPKNEAQFKLIIVHGFGSSKDMIFLLSQELINELKLYMLLYDRAGYGESSPNPNRSPKSEAADIEELAEKMQLGPKFYLIGISIGSYPLWSCLRRIPRSLAGAALVVPMINYKWQSLPDDLVKDDMRKSMAKWAFWAARYAPCLVHLWLTQKLFPSKNILERNPKFFCDKDLEVLKDTPAFQLLGRASLQRKEVFDCLRRDFMAAFGKWDFDPLELSNPFSSSSSSSSSAVHIWHGGEDKVVPAQLQRFVAAKLPWIRYHEVAERGHLLIYDASVCEAIVRSLLLGEDYQP
ncbi:uncharacterized protein LOC124916702 [Impatiens glandulifera]|uniref:uncharacterized protein LOC124916702 n=1 Tax=Impatiens glandulifera TaxID=253017 RepID=UPI001FB0F851|nr:uncharacterized protein LOC124916702 [Impatiens glandulifera]